MHNISTASTRSNVKFTRSAQWCKLVPNAVLFCFRRFPGTWTYKLCTSPAVTKCTPYCSNSSTCTVLYPVPPARRTAYAPRPYSYMHSTPHSMGNPRTPHSPPHSSLSACSPLSLPRLPCGALNDNNNKNNTRKTQCSLYRVKRKVCTLLNVQDHCFSNFLSLLKFNICHVFLLWNDLFALLMFLFSVDLWRY